MKLVLIVGPSGAGKDTLLRSAKKEFAKNQHIGFVRRYITRPPDDNEDNYYIESSAFTILKDSNFFISTWQAHQNYYGISSHSVTSNPNARCQICSVSRGSITDFELKYPDTLTINVTTDSKTLRKRLMKRGRENREQIDKRLQRAQKTVIAKDILHFDNSAPLEYSIDMFLSLISQLSKP